MELTARMRKAAAWALYYVAGAALEAAARLDVGAPSPAQDEVPFPPGRDEDDDAQAGCSLGVTVGPEAQDLIARPARRAPKTDPCPPLEGSLEARLGPSAAERDGGCGTSYRPRRARLG